VYLYDGARQIGGYDLDEHYYRPFEGGVWGPVSEAPIPPPCFGVAAHKLDTAPSYAVNGRPASREAIFESLANGLSDDSHKLRVTLIGPEPLRRTLRGALETHPEFAELRTSLVVRDYAPEHWAVQAGFVTTGAPTVYCQAPTGKVLHRQDEDKGGADALVAALRKAKESYDPRRDPDLRPGVEPAPLPGPLPAPPGGNVVPSLLFAAMVGGVLVLVGRRLREHRMMKGA
jgi:hypothetical protein